VSPVEKRKGVLFWYHYPCREGGKGKKGKRGKKVPGDLDRGKNWLMLLHSGREKEHDAN